MLCIYRGMHCIWPCTHGVREGALSLSAFELLSVELPVSIWQAVSVLLKFDVDATPFPFFCVVPVHVFFSFGLNEI